MENRNKESTPMARNKLAFQGGSYSLIITAVVLTILVVINVFASSLPTTLTHYDISATQLYSITSNTKVVVNALEDDVTIYWVVQAGKEDDIIENLLTKYDSLSDHINIVKKNPDIYPAFAEQYTSETVNNNSLIVECGERSRFISYSDLYVQETDMNTYSTQTSFDGEGAITSAIDYVVTEDLPQLYILEGHGETALSTVFSEQIERENIETSTFSLLNQDAVPEQADCVLIYAPQSDISEDERDMLMEYVEGGGKMLVLAGPVEDDSLDNLYGILSAYGVERQEGVVVEEAREYYAFQRPYILMPTMTSSDVTDPLINEHYYALIPLAQGLTVNETAKATVTELLTTSESSFSKVAGYDLSTYDKEEGDIDGPFAVAVSIDGGGEEGDMIWFSSSEFMEPSYNSYSSGANLDLGMNALSSLIGEREAVAIRSKSLDYNYLTISTSNSSLLKILMIGVFPLAYLGVGIAIVIGRRKQQNETV